MCKESLIKITASTDLGPRTRMPDKILKGDHQRIILAKLESMISLDLQPTWSLLLEIKNGEAIKKILISETTGPIGTKLCLVL
jgi:hypothetical protein